MPKRPILTARTADRHILYQRAVQSPESEFDFVERVFRRMRGRLPVRIREDFCGTALASCEWVKRSRANEAVAVDLHAPTLAWARSHNAAALSAEQLGRLKLLRRDVLHPRADSRGMDAVLAMNFSYWVFKTRPLLVEYFRRVRESLVRDGLFFLDHFGGWEVMREQKERRREGGFTYIWDQAKYNPINGDYTCHIHFEFKKGPPMRRAFTYHWRLWTLPEVKDCLRDAGFKSVGVYWEGDDEKGGGNGIFRRQKRAAPCASYITYIVASR